MVNQFAPHQFEAAREAAFADSFNRLANLGKEGFERIEIVSYKNNQYVPQLKGKPNWFWRRVQCIFGKPQQERYEVVAAFLDQYIAKNKDLLCSDCQLNEKANTLRHIRSRFIRNSQSAAIKSLHEKIDEVLEEITSSFGIAGTKRGDLLSLASPFDSNIAIHCKDGAVVLANSLMLSQTATFNTWKSVGMNKPIIVGADQITRTRFDLPEYSKEVVEALVKYLYPEQAVNLPANRTMEFLHLVNHLNLPKAKMDPIVEAASKLEYENNDAIWQLLQLENLGEIGLEVAAKNYKKFLSDNRLKGTSLAGVIIERAKLKDYYEYQILVKDMGGGMSTYCIKPTAKIEDFKRLIAARKNMPVDQQRIIFAGKQLEDGNTLKHYNVPDESTFYLVLRMKGD